ncbi:AAA family ATPase [Blastococcus sp. SYSU D01042]
MLVGRETELRAIAAAVESARSGRCATVVLEGDPGVGKTTLLDAAVDSATGFCVVRTVGIEADLRVGHAALLDLLGPLRTGLSQLPGAQAAALQAALGWSAGARPGDRHLVAAATLSLLAAAAERRPVLVVVDDLQWVDAESAGAVAFSARRLGGDRVAFVLARRPAAGPEDGPDDLAGLPRHQVAGLEPAAALALLEGRIAAPVARRLVAATAGNPLALEELARCLTPEQRRGSVPLPDALPVGTRIAEGFARIPAEAPAGVRRALLLAATAAEQAAGPVVAALRAEGVDAERALAQAEDLAVLVVDQGRLAFPHPLVRSALLAAASPAERRSAHAALAAVLVDHPQRRARHLAQATLGHDDALAADIEGLAADERSRRGYAGASQLQERAALLRSSAVTATRSRATAVHDALLAGDVTRVRRLAGEVLAGPAEPAARGQVLWCLGELEQYAGSVPAAEGLLREAADTAEGHDRLRALGSLAFVGYRLGARETVTRAAAEIRSLADPEDPEHAVLADFTEGSALGFAGRWAEARAPSLRALERLEGDPRLRHDPRFLVMALLAPFWAGEPRRVWTYADRWIDAARSAGALGVLPPVLSLVASGTAFLGDHRRAYATAGEAVEMGAELGYAADVATAYELLAWEEAARGRHAEADSALVASRRLAERAEVADGAVFVHLVDAFAAFCRGDLHRVVDVLERRIAVDGGRLPRGDYELGVAPDLVEAYLGLGRRADAGALAARHAALHAEAVDPGVRAHVARLAGLLAEDRAVAERAFARAHEAHAEGDDSFAAARTRLLHGTTLRHAGQRVAARAQLREALAAFDAMGLEAWSSRARAELAATGLRVRRPPGTGGELTSQETRVALLVAQGLSNRDIAAALFLSPRTVEHHVTTALRKRGLRSRAALAAAFATRS